MTTGAAEVSPLRRGFKSASHAVALVLVAPAAACVWIERTAAPRSEFVFAFFAQLFAVIPGYPGLALRRAFYVCALEACSADFFIGFGSMFTHRRAIVERGVYIGNFSSIGCARLHQGALIGSYTSLLSGGALHDLDPIAGWTPFTPSRLVQIDISAQVWIGERCVVMADVGHRAMVAAGSVVSSAVPAGVVVAGNPARFVRRLEVNAEPAAGCAV